MTEQSAINEHWLLRWQEGRIGWHHHEFNTHLLNHWNRVEAPTGCTVFVPLCGKSLDMAWLAEQGHDVVGIELSPLAIKLFFQEQQLTPARSHIAGMEIWQAGPYRILCADIFDLRKEHIGPIDAVYDRASLVAFDPQQRRDYAALLEELLSTGTPMLLVAMDYPQEEMQGPPYSVTADEVAMLFDGITTLEQIDSLDLMKDSDRLAFKGLSRLHEEIYRLTFR